MSEESIMGNKIKDMYKMLCASEWNATVSGVIVAFLSVMIMAWWRPWGAVGAIRNWGDWMIHGVASVTGAESGFLGYYATSPSFPLINSGSVIGIGFIAGAFISACLGKDFAFRIPPYREMVKAVIAGILMGIGATLAGGCNVGGMYNAIGNLAANGFTMWIGLVAGVLLGLKLLYLEMEYISWGDGGSGTIEIPKIIQNILALLTIAGLVWLAYFYANGKAFDFFAKYATYKGSETTFYVASLGGLIMIAAGLGYTMQRGRWCMVQGFREPHMTGDCTLAKSVALSILIVAIGGAVLKYSVPQRMLEVRTTFNTVITDIKDEAEDSDINIDEIVQDADGNVAVLQEAIPVLAPANYVRKTFGWGSIVGGFIFGLGAMLAGGCGSGTLWRVGEGQVKLIMVVPFFAIANSLMTKWFKNFGEKGYSLEANDKLGSYVYLPDVMGYGATLAMIGGIMLVWYLVVTWNEDSNKLIVPM